MRQVAHPDLDIGATLNGKGAAVLLGQFAILTFQPYQQVGFLPVTDQAGQVLDLRLRDPAFDA